MSSDDDHEGSSDRYEVEAADMQTHIPESNIGYKLMLKMGWKAGTGLGQHATGECVCVDETFSPLQLELGHSSVVRFVNYNNR